MELYSYDISLRIFVTFWMVILGAVFGSAILCAVDRYIAKEQWKSWFTGHSKCDSCGQTLEAADLVPIFSYLITRGKCRHCYAPIPKLALGSELASAAAFGLIGWHFGISLELAMWAIFVIVLLALSFVDIQTRIIPNGLLIAAAVNRLVWLFVLQEPLVATLTTMGYSLIIPVALLVIVLIFERIRKVEAMGGGDIKLLLVMALYLNWMQLIVALLAACIIGIICGGAKLSKTIPFGPSLAAGCILAATILAPIATWYASLL